MTTFELTETMPAMPLFPGAQIVLEAISPTTGLPIAGVTVSNVAIYALEAGAAAGGGVSELIGPFLLVPGPEA